MQTIIQPVEKQKIKKELTKNKFLRPTNKARNEIYIVDAHNAPNTMLEIGRLRELSFRAWGGGSGKEMDTDEYDFLEKPYQQLIVWNPDNEEIIGGYRFLLGKDVEFDENGQPKITMSHLYQFSQKFIDEYLPVTIELGRAFVQPDYQSSKKGMKSLFALDNLWDGLGALTHKTKSAKYCIGKVTIYNNYQPEARDLIYAYLERFCADPDRLIFPKNEFLISQETKQLANKFFSGKDRNDNYKILQKMVRASSEVVPPLINAYIGLTNTMRTFGNTVYADFGNTYETGIMITINDILEAKYERYIAPYIHFIRIKLAELQKERKAKAEKARKIKAEKLKQSELNF